MSLSSHSLPNVKILVDYNKYQQMEEEIRDMKRKHTEKHEDEEPEAKRMDGGGGAASVSSSDEEDKSEEKKESEEDNKKDSAENMEGDGATLQRFLSTERLLNEDVKKTQRPEVLPVAIYKKDGSSSSDEDEKEEWWWSLV